MPHAAAVQAGQLCRRRGACNGVAGACHGNRGGCAGAGRHRRDPACRLAGVDPHRLCAGIVIVYVIGGKLCRGAHTVIAVDGLRHKGQAFTLGCHKGALQTAEQDGGNIHLTVRHGVAQRGAVHTAACRICGKGIVQQHCALFQSHGLALRAAQIAPQADGIGLVQLCCRKTAGQGGDIVAQQGQGGSAGFFQCDGVIRAEGTVGVAAHPALLHCNADIGRISAAAVHIGIQGADAALRIGVIVVGRKGHQQLCQLPAGERRAQPGRFLGGESAQRHRRLHRRVGARCRSRQHQHGHADAHRQQQCEKSFFHSCLLNFGLALRESSGIAPLQADRAGERVISHSAALRWGSAGPHALRAGSRTAHRCPPKCQRPQPPNQGTATRSFPYRS